MAVLEARPLFLYTGNWAWSQPWTFFRSGFYVGLLAVIGAGGGDLAIAPRRSPADRLLHHRELPRHARPEPLRLLPGAGHRGGDRLAGRRVLDWGGVPHAGNPTPTIKRPLPFQREIAVIPVAGLVVAPNLVPAALTTHARGRHAGLLVRRDAMAAHEHAGAVRLRRLLPRALRRDQSAGELQRDELVGPGLLDPADRPARAGHQSHAERRAQRGRSFSPRPTKPKRSRCSRAHRAALRARRLGAAVSRRRRRRAGRPLPEPRRLGRHSDVAFLFAVFLAAREGDAVAADLVLSRGRITRRWCIG